MGMLLGVDFGTGGGKACVLDPDGEVRGYAFEEYPIRNEHPGWSEHDAPGYWAVARSVVRKALLEAAVPGSEITGVALSSALPSLVIVGDDGEPLAPGINLMDRRARAEVELVKAIIGDDVVQSVCANRLEDHPSIVNLLWFKRNRPQVFKAIHKALTIDGYIAYRLTGEPSVNRSAGVFYGVAYDIRAGAFRKELLDAVEIDEQILPKVVGCRDIVGVVTRPAAEDMGLAAGTPVFGGQVDCNAGWLAGGAVLPGDVHLNLGTCGVLGVIHDDEPFLGSETASYMVNIPYTTSPDKLFTAVAVTLTGGQVLRYLREKFGSLEEQAGKLLGVNAYDLLTLQARDVPPGSEGLVVLPYLMGERTPIWDASARGVLFGLSLHHGRGHVYRAFMEGVAYALRHSLTKLLEAHLKVSWPLVLNEGGAKSDVWRKIMTDVLGVPTVVLKSRSGAAIGDAILAGVAVGEFDDFSVARELATYSEPLLPDEETHERYTAYYELYRALYVHLVDDFKVLGRLAEGTRHEGA